MEIGDIAYFIHLGITGETQIHKVKVVASPDQFHPRTAKGKVLKIYLDIFHQTSTNLKVGDILRYPEDKLFTPERLKKFVAEKKFLLFNFIFNIMELKK